MSRVKTCQWEHDFYYSVLCCSFYWILLVIERGFNIFFRSILIILDILWIDYETSKSVLILGLTKIDTRLSYWRWVYILGKIIKILLKKISLQVYMIVLHAFKKLIHYIFLYYFHVTSSPLCKQLKSLWIQPLVCSHLVVIFLFL